MRTWLAAEWAIAGRSRRRAWHTYPERWAGYWQQGSWRAVANRGGQNLAVGQQGGLLPAKGGDIA